jgi:hypothetical protein
MVCGWAPNLAVIFYLNLPVGLLAVAFLARTPVSPPRAAPFDAMGQAMAVLAMGALIYGAIEAGVLGLGAAPVWSAFVLALLALIAFVWSQRRGAHPMVPAGLLAPRNARISMAVGFTFMVGYFGLPFVMSLYLQQQRGLSAPEPARIRPRRRAPALPADGAPSPDLPDPLVQPDAHAQGLHERGPGFGAPPELRGKELFVVTTPAGGEDAYSPKGRLGFTIEEVLTPLRASANYTGMKFAMPLCFYAASGDTNALRYREALEAKLREQSQ